MKLYRDKTSTWIVASESEHEALQYFIVKGGEYHLHFASSLDDIEELQTPFNPKKGIHDAETFVEYCCELLDYWLSDIDNYQAYTRPFNENYDYCESDHPPEFMYTRKGTDLVERAIGRLYRLGEKHYEYLDDEIKSNYFTEA